SPADSRSGSGTGGLDATLQIAMGTVHNARHSFRLWAPAVSQLVSQQALRSRPRPTARRVRRMAAPRVRRRPAHERTTCPARRTAPPVVLAVGDVPDRGG